MCFHSKQSKDAQTLEKRFKAKAAEDAQLSADRFNGFTFPKTPVITNKNPQLIQLFNWGLIPVWAKDTSIRASTLNARIETVCELPSFKNNIGNRCLILADGFYEWQWLDPKGKKKQQYLISLPNDEPFAFAGIYSQWTDKSSGEIINTYSMLTTEANALMAEIHNHKKRMPVILTPDNENRWLQGNDVHEFAKPEIELKATVI
ncbi:MAG: SOS response-associated peptidase [Bacteroidota bacterium]|nr:SOS response-associated peptidase [Bacteroidota bacterium]